MSAAVAMNRTHDDEIIQDFASPVASNLASPVPGIASPAASLSGLASPVASVPAGANVSRLSGLGSLVTGAKKRKKDDEKKEKKRAKVQCDVKPRAEANVHMVLESSRELTNALEIIAFFCDDEVGIDFGPQGIRIKQMNSGHTGVVQFFWRSQACKFFMCNENEKICVNMPSLVKVLKSMGDSQLTLEHVHSSDVVSFVFESEKEGKISMDLRLIEANDGDGLDIEGLEHTVFVEMNSKLFYNTLNRLSTLKDDGKTFAFQVSDGKLLFKMTFNLGNMDADLDRTEGFKYKVDTDEEFTSAFSTALLLVPAKASSVADTVHLSLADEQPMKLHYKLDNGCELTFYISPLFADD